MGISLEETKGIITPDIAKLVLESIVCGFDDYSKKLDEESRAICSAATRASFVNDHMIHHARDKMKNHPNVKFINRRGRTHLFIGDMLEVKLKKLDRNRRPSNILTQEVSDYHNQIPLKPPLQLEFSGMLDPIANLIAGYQLNRLRTGIEAVYIVCPQGDENRWEWKLDFVAKPSMITEVQPVKDYAKSKAVAPRKKLVREKID